MRKRITDLCLSVVASIAALFLSWPYWRDFEYWPESPLAWGIYFVVGFVLAVYVFNVFLGVVHTLFEHDKLEKAEAAQAASGNGAEGQS